MNKLAPTAATEKPVALRSSEREREQRHQDVLTRARKRFAACVTAESDNRKNAIDDLKFKSGEGQWPMDVVAQRNFDKRPTLTINKLPTFVNQVVNDQRMNRPAINISPVGDKADPEVAKMYRGLIRAIERYSSADIAYDTAFDSAVSNGFGYWRIGIEYEAPDSFDQQLVVHRIRNPFTVYIDPQHQEPDGADARFAFVTELIPREEFERDWPDADPMPWTEGGFGEDYKYWVTDRDIRIAEMFEIEIEKRRLVQLENGHVGWWDELSADARRLEVVEERWSDFPQLRWYKLTAVNVLMESDWPGQWIPIVKVIGNEIDIEGKVRLSGLIRNAKGPQMMYNYNRTLSVELSSLQPKAPWILAEGQVEGYEQQWKKSNVTTYPYLTYKPTDLAGRQVPPPQRQPFQGANTSIMQEVQAAAQDMMAVTGLRFDATLGERVYDESGRALRELRERGDLGSFHYVDNLARSMRHSGRIMVDLIPHVYETKRIVTILREDDGDELVQLDPAAQQPFAEARNPASRRMMKIFNPTYGRYGVTVTIGPSYATKRIEAAESMMDFVRALAPAAPQMAAGIADLIVKEQDWPGAEQFAARLAKMLPPNLLTPDMKDIPPQVQAALDAMQQQLQALENEKQQLIRALTEQQADRAQRQDEIDKNFEAKVLTALSNFEAKMADVARKADESAMTRVMEPIERLAEGVAAMRDALERSRPEAPEIEVEMTEEA